VRRDEVSLGDDVVDVEAEVGKGTTHAGHELLERVRAFDVSDVVEEEARGEGLVREILVVRESLQVQAGQGLVPLGQRVDPRLFAPSMIRGVHHTSRTVSDMERSLGFYRDALGMPVVLDTEMSGEMLEREVAMDGAHLRFVLLDSGGDTFLELLQYYSPPGEPLSGTAKPADVGAHHVALLVGDIAAAYEELVAAGVRFTYVPQEVDAGFFRGHWTAYCYDPDGLIVELWQLPASA
jgi:catechol 2,3-dioxygenase-like lactoylglutathione lyase family enzyme